MIDAARFFDALRKAPFGVALTQAQVDGIGVILAAFARHALAAPPAWIAYVLATAFHETARRMQPIAEFGKGHGRAYGVVAGPFGQTYYGRGYVQLTWQANYRHATQRLRQIGVIDAALDLERDADLALRPDIAAAILIFGMVEGWFSGRKLSDCFGAGRDDPLEARHIVNGADRAALIAGYHRDFLAALRGALKLPPAKGLIDMDTQDAAAPGAIAGDIARTVATAIGGPVAGAIEQALQDALLPAARGSAPFPAPVTAPQPGPAPGAVLQPAAMWGGTFDLGNSIAAQIAPAALAQSKSWARSQTVWGGIAALLSGIGIAAYGWQAKDPNLAIAGMGAAAGGVSAIVGRFRVTVPIK